MINFPIANSIEEIRNFVSANPVSFIYISREGCSVCHAVKPKVQKMLEEFPEIKPMQVSADDVPEVAGEYTVFTVPALLLFIEGKEMFREARFVVMDDLHDKFERIVNNYEIA
ncbi:thioredoxin family protein [Marinilactibacillus psychrotolerans]|uniref:thioredoxin family protein n=1 Tax=Marinilactibacillus psychrotolerans TaxID=191770 RepID=UPI003884B0DC